MKTRVVLLTMLFLFGCDKDNPVSTESDTDKQLKQLIVGTWSSDNVSSMQYNSDGTFLDSAYTKNSDTSAYTLLCVFEGKYNIVNSVLYLTNLHIKYAKDSWGASVGAYSEISIEGNKMISQPVEVYTPNQQFRSELYGSWSQIEWMSAKIYPTQYLYEGRGKRSYTFIRDSSYFVYNYEYLDANGPQTNSSTVAYKFINSALITNNVDTIKVAFKYNQMYWYRNYRPYVQTKIR